MYYCPFWNENMAKVQDYATLNLYEYNDDHDGNDDN